MVDISSTSTAGATSWTHPAIVKLRALEGVGAVVSHQCEFGLETTAADGRRALALKPTRFMSSAPAVLEALSRRCQGGHAHAPLLGGTRAKDAAVYPPGLCKAIAQGAAEQLRRDERARRPWVARRAQPCPDRVCASPWSRAGRGRLGRVCTGPWSRAGRGWWRAPLSTSTQMRPESLGTSRGQATGSAPGNASVPRSPSSWWARRRARCSAGYR